MCKGKLCTPKREQKSTHKLFAVLDTVKEERAGKIGFPDVYGWETVSKETVFSVFCIESYKAYRSLTGWQTAELFRRYGVFDYLREFYDVLHTTGYQYINRDIDIYLKSRNAVIPARQTDSLPHAGFARGDAV